VWSRAGLSVVAVPVGFDSVFEPVEAGRPQFGEEVLQRGHPVRVDQVQPALAGAAHADEAGLAQHLEVQRDSLLCDGEMLDSGGFAVEEADGHARVVWESSFVPVDPAMAEQLAQLWEPFLPIVLSNLKHLVEDR
jgi:hypothetical protein